MSSPPPTSSPHASPNIYEYTPSTNREVRIKQLSWEAVCPFPKVIKLYNTGCSSEKVFMFIVNRVRSKHKKVSYFKDHSRSFTIKQYQNSPASKYLSRCKPGPSRQLHLEDRFY